MTRNHWSHSGMTLFSDQGERKYLDLDEGERFLNHINVLDDETEQTFCATLYLTGCRPCEALSLRAIQIEVAQCVIRFCSAKKRGDWKGRKFRDVPVPPEYMRWLDRVHGIRQAQLREDRGASYALWSFCRTTGWDRTKRVMNAADIQGIKACARGLRHGYGVRGALKGVEPALRQKTLGHEDYETTAIYTDVIGPEQYAMVARMWDDHALRPHHKAKCFDKVDL